MLLSEKAQQWILDNLASGISYHMQHSWFVDGKELTRQEEKDILPWCANWRNPQPSNRPTHAEWDEMKKAGRVKLKSVGYVLETNLLIEASESPFPYGKTLIEAIEKAVQ